MSGKPLKFSQEDIIGRQHSRRAARHLKPVLPSKTFAIGDIVFSNSDRSKLKARDKLVVREYLGNGQYRLDRLCGKSTYITSTTRPDYDLYTVETVEETPPPKQKKSVTWDDNVTIINIDHDTPEPDQYDPTNGSDASRSRPAPWSSAPQKLRAASNTRRPIPPAPGRAASYRPQSEHPPQASPEPITEYLVIPYHESYIEAETPPTAASPPQSIPEQQDQVTPDTDSEDSDGDVFLSPGESPNQNSPNDSSEHNDPEQSDQSNGLNQSQNNSGSNDTEQEPSNEPNDGGHLSREARGRAPIRRQRSKSHPPTKLPPKTTQHALPPKDTPHVHAPGEALCDTCQQQGATAPREETVAQPQREQNPMPTPEPNHQEETPPTAAQGAQPQQVSRYGRQILRPSALGYLPNFAQQESRNPSPRFRLPRPAAPKPAKSAKPTDI